jgi:flagellar motility protein MotE (MotC chaperone)
MLKRLRILPVLIVFAFASFGVKVGGLWNEAERFVGLAVPVAQAAETTAGEENTLVNEGDGDEPEPEVGSESADDDALTAVVEGTARQEGKASEQIFTEAEVQLLQDLAARRELLEVRARELDFRENLLEAAEQQIEGQIAELREIEAKINALIQQHDAQEEGKLRSLVRVYETMKPKQAARIFNQLDLDILLDVAELMSERRLAPVLAAMTPQRATTVTVEIRTRKQLPKRLETGENDAAAALPGGTEGGQGG